VLTTIAMLIVFVCASSITLSVGAAVEKFNAELMELAIRERCDYRELLLICGMGGLELMDRGITNIFEVNRSKWRSMRPIRDPDAALARLLALGVSSDAAALVLETQRRLANENNAAFKKCYIPGGAFILVAFIADALLA